MSTQSDELGGPSPAAASLVGPPATGLIVTAAIGMVVQVIGIITNLAGVGIGAAGAAADSPEAMGNLIGGSVGVVVGIVGIAFGAVILVGALKMKKLESYGFAMAASIMAAIPCISPCCLLGLPIGIWAIVVLMKPEVKSAFH